ncbi:hypothetical protein [Comamonas kerstersii]
MEILLRILIACPKCLFVLGSMMSTLCMALLAASIRMARRIDMAENRAGLVLSVHVLERLPLASTTLEFLALALGVVAGLCLMWVAKWLKRWGV